MRPFEELLHAPAAPAVEAASDEELTRLFIPEPVAEPEVLAEPEDSVDGPLVYIPPPVDDADPAVDQIAEPEAERPPQPEPGVLPAAIVQRIVRLNMGTFRSCYQRGLQRSPKLSGKVIVRFVIRRDGLVGRAANAGSKLSDPRVVQCIVRGFFNLRFPEQPRSLTVKYPLRLTNGSVDPKKQALKADQKARWAVDTGGEPTVEQRLFKALKQGVEQGPPKVAKKAPPKKAKPRPAPSAHDDRCPRGDPLCAELPE